MLGVALAPCVIGVLLLQMCGVAQDDRAKVRGAGGEEHRPAVSLRDQARQPADVIQMRVADDNGVQTVGGDRKRFPVASAELPLALEQAAVDQHRPPVMLDEEPAARHGLGRAEKRQ